MRGFSDWFAPRFRCGLAPGMLGHDPTPSDRCSNNAGSRDPLRRAKVALKPMLALEVAALRHKSLVGLVQFTAVMMLLIFLPAWSLDYWQAWLFLAVFVAALAGCN